MGSVTVHDVLLARTPATDLRRASDALTAALPVGRTVKITPEALDAAAAGDVATLALLFAEEVEPDEIDLAALRDIDADDHEGAASIDDVRRELGLNR